MGISIHAPRTGSDPNAPAKLPTAPISIHAPRTGSDARRLFGFAAAAISIHAPRTGSDQGYRRAWRRVQANFNPRSPHGERRFSTPEGVAPLEFQSTLPARGATPEKLPALICAKNFNPRSPHGERRYSVAPASKRTHFNPRSPHGERRAGRSDRRPDRPISIHAPRTGSDTPPRPRCRCCCHFNPRSPHGERRFFKRPCSNFPSISIHAPRTGSDWFDTIQDCIRKVFQSTLPARGATRWKKSAQNPQKHFNPRSPHGERPCDVLATYWESLFQSTLPARGATPTAKMYEAEMQIFQSTLPARGATLRGTNVCGMT